ncbi:Ammonium/H(+) antiporter subunit AmhT [bacterium HR19]|nr:Ammonium/H(+) antiporter subunit AmhT [bacterium HR19]
MTEMHFSPKSGFIFFILFLIPFFLRFGGVPYIISFIICGILGKLFFTKDDLEHLKIFEGLGLSLLFFFIGLEYSFEKLFRMKKIILPGLIDFSFNFLLLFVILILFFGFGFRDSLMLSAVLYPTSTAIVSKLIIDTKRVANPETDFLINLLIFEDLVIIIFLIFFYSFTEGRELGLSSGLIFLKMSLVFLFFYILSLIFKRFSFVLDRIAEEDIFIFLIFGVVILFSFGAKEIGFSEVVSSFLLGVAMPETKVKQKIQSSLSSIKELSVGLFFFFFSYRIGLDIRIQVSHFEFFSLIFLPLILKFLSTYFGARAFGLNSYVSLRSGLSFLPRGEFSFVLIPSLKEDISYSVFNVVLVLIFVGIVSFIFAPRVLKIAKI